MSPRQHVYIINKELDALRLEFSRLAEEPEEVIRRDFHEGVTDKIRSLLARADNMEAVQKGLFTR